jgi:hypothetical protein
MGSYPGLWLADPLLVLSSSTRICRSLLSKQIKQRESVGEEGDCGVFSPKTLCKIL